MTLAEARALLERPTITVKQFADMFGLSLSGAYDAIARDEVPATRIGETIRVLTPPLAARLALQSDKALAA